MSNPDAELNEDTKEALEGCAKVCNSVEKEAVKLAFVEKEAVKLASKVGKMNLSDRGNEVHIWKPIYVFEKGAGC